MRLILATTAALGLSLAGIGSAHAACCDVITPAVPQTPPPAQPIREAPVAFFTFLVPTPPPPHFVTVPGELLPGPPPVFLTDSPLAPRPPQRFDVLTR